MHAIEFEELIVTTFFLPVDDLLANFINYHFLSPAGKAKVLAA